MRLRSAALALCASLSLLPAPHVSAASVDILYITGSGTISPGLDTVLPKPQSISFSGTATTVGTDGVLATYACSVSGSGLNDNLAAGFGVLSGSCGPISFTTCTFVRDHADTSVQCVATSPAKTLTGKFVFTPDDVNPVRHYTLSGIAWYLSVP